MGVTDSYCYAEGQLGEAFEGQSYVPVKAGLHVS